MSCEPNAQLQLCAAPLKRLHQYSAPHPKAGLHAWEELTLPHDTGQPVATQNYILNTFVKSGISALILTTPEKSGHFLICSKNKCHHSHPNKNPHFINILLLSSISTSFETEQHEQVFPKFLTPPNLNFFGLRNAKIQTIETPQPANNEGKHSFLENSDTLFLKIVKL